MINRTLLCSVMGLIFLNATEGQASQQNLNGSRGPTRPTVQAPQEQPLPIGMDHIRNIIRKHNGSEAPLLQELCGKSGVSKSGKQVGSKMLKMDCTRGDVPQVVTYLCRGKQNFDKTSCGVNAKKTLKNLKMYEPTMLEAIMAKGVRRDGSNIRILVCSGDAAFKDKLPQSLKKLLGNCEKPMRPKTLPPAVKKAQVIQWIKAVIGNTEPTPRIPPRSRMMEAGKRLPQEHGSKLQQQTTQLSGSIDVGKPAPQQTQQLKDVTVHKFDLKQKVKTIQSQAPAQAPNLNAAAKDVVDSLTNLVQLIPLMPDAPISGELLENLGNFQTEVNNAKNAKELEDLMKDLTTEVKLFPKN